MIQLRKHLRTNRQRMARFRFRAHQRAAKESIRQERAARAEPLPDLSHVRLPRLKPSGFRVVITCLDDGVRSQFTTRRTPWDTLTISASAAGRRVAAVLLHYQPAAPAFNPQLSTLNPQPQQAAP